MAGTPSRLEIIEVLPSLLREVSPGGAELTIFELTVPPEAQKRVVHRPELKAVIQASLRLRSDHGVPFWDAMMLNSLSQPEDVRSILLDACGLHQPMSAAVAQHRISVTDLDSPTLRSILTTAKEGSISVFSSRLVMPDGTENHLPLLDFRLPVSATSSAIIEDVVRRLELQGIVLESGNSYHFYGRRLLSPKELRELLGRAILYAPIVDYRWIAHQLVEGACALRISRGKSFSYSPRVLLEVR
ncbi:hypothetical protein [Micromonospora sp. NBRC 101691]|uniref:primase 1D-like protein n=1 Tax=Micromonospora sp. NBRC 101691 TaxID=3032198 RepID=UPI002554B6E1|nr:hypothetical protein [Micromonospora sp. NBRC 101691]